MKHWLGCVTVVVGWFFCIVANALTEQAAFNMPYASSTSQAGEWNLATEPNQNSTSRWIFDTTNSFLQHWPNTRLRNGHNIVPGIVPVGTLLYHGTSKKEIPKVPEWTATDPEHSYPFCRSWAPNTPCWHLTLVAARPLRVLYFDGSSAAKMWGGSMDSQDVLVWGGVQPNRTYDERNRIVDLCNWGKQYDIDGFLRMEMDFEIMVCDFSAGLDVLSFLDLPSVNSGSPPPTWPIFRALESGSWHNYFPGESRINLDYSRIVSFYDTELFPGLQGYRSGKDRWDHNLENISSREVQVLQKTLDRTLKGDWGYSSSGIDWRVLFGVVADRYNERLELLYYILNGTSITSEANAEALLKQAQRQMKAMLMPYILQSVYHPPAKSDSPLNRQWATPIFEHCATTHIRYMEKNAVLYSKMTRSERLLIRSVKDVSKEICRVLVGMWAEGADRGLESDSQDVMKNQEHEEVTQNLLRKWTLRVAGLMEWLDWGYWAKCRPACGYEEMCYMPTWPFFKKLPPGPIPGYPPEFVSMFSQGLKSDIEEPDPDDDWYHPQPRCIRRIEPFGVE